MKNTENNRNEMKVNRYFLESTKENTENNRNEMKVNRYFPESTKENTFWNKYRRTRINIKVFYILWNFNK